MSSTEETIIENQELSSNSNSKFSLQEEINQFEQHVGPFNYYYQSNNNTNPKSQDTHQKSEDVAYEDKPGQQMIKALGGEKLNENDAGELPQLSQTADKSPLQAKQIQIDGRSFNASEKKLTIEKARIQMLVDSAFIHTNNKYIKKEDYAELVKFAANNASYKIMQAPNSDLLTLELASQICHVQKIDFLVDQIIQDGPKSSQNFQGKKSEDNTKTVRNNGYTVAKEGVINNDAPAILLLSSPAIDFTKSNIPPKSDKALQLLTDMYAHFFALTEQQGYEYITLPAIGLGAFKGDPATHHKALIAAAKAHPKLNIIYHPGAPANVGLFEKTLKEHPVPNLATTKKDVMFLADKLTKSDKPCALVNPSDADAVLGKSDVGKNWKGAKGLGFVGEEFLGQNTSAVLNSAKLNPNAYKNLKDYCSNLEHGEVLFNAILKYKKTAASFIENKQHKRSKEANAIIKLIAEFPIDYSSNMLQKDTRVLHQFLALKAQVNALDDCGIWGYGKHVKEELNKENLHLKDTDKAEKEIGDKTAKKMGGDVEKAIIETNKQKPQTASTLAAHSMFKTSNDNNNSSSSNDAQNTRSPK